MLQIVEGQDGSLSGSLQTATANGRFQVNVESVGLSGTIDGNMLTLATPTFLGMGTTFSGVRSGNEIALTYAGRANVKTITFNRSTPEEFTRLAEELRQGQRLRGAENERQQAAARTQASDEQMRRAIPSLSAELEQTAANDVEMTRRVDGTVGQFSTLTQRARDAASARDRERDGVRQSQLSVFISQVSVETTQLNIEVEQAQRQFEQHRVSLRDQVQRATAWCERTRDAVCTRLASASARYGSDSAALAAAFGRAGAAHQRADADQRQL
jgi:hypothetical protein